MGLLFFNVWARRVYVVIVFLGGLLIPMYGMSVQSGYENALNYFMTLGDGFIICLSFFTSINQQFIRDINAE